MNAEALIKSLERLGVALPALVRDIPVEDTRWRPADGAWSVLEVLRHLLDEEVEDFRRRLESTLCDPSEPWSPNDPAAWAVERRYNEADPAETVKRLVVERGKSVEWLRSLESTDWSQAYEHPQWGPIRAGDILVSWAGHDALHLRQIAKRMFQMAQRDGGTYKTDYAGEWKA